jgi:hypothetical protein
MENIEIKSCPFCGERPEFIKPKDFSTEGREVRLQCVNSKCLWKVSTYTSQDKNDLIKIWNQRS